MQMIYGVTHIDSGVEVVQLQDEKTGDVWERVSQICWFKDGRMTPAGRLADFFMNTQQFK